MQANKNICVCADVCEFFECACKYGFQCMQFRVQCSVKVYMCMCFSRHLGVLEVNHQLRIFKFLIL